MIFKQGLRTISTLTFWGCDDTDTGGVFGVLLDGVRYDGDALIAANHYTGIVTVNVSSGSHTVQPLIDGVAVGPQIACKTAPAAGQPVKLIFSGDAAVADQPFNFLSHYHNDVDALFGTEMEYIDGAEYASAPGAPEPINTINLDDTVTTTCNGGAAAGVVIIPCNSTVGFVATNTAEVTMDVGVHLSEIASVDPGVSITVRTAIPVGRSVANGASIKQKVRYTPVVLDTTYYDRYLDSYRKKYRNCLTQVGNKMEYYSRVPCYTAWNNHEYDSDTYLPKPGQSQWDGAARAHYEYLTQHCVINTDADSDSVPTESRFYFDIVIGDIHIIHLDNTAYSNGATSGIALDGDQNPVATEWQERGQNKQWLWAQNKIINSTSKIIIIVVPSMILANQVSYNDPTNGLVKLLMDKSGVTGFFVSADSHRPFFVRHDIFSKSVLEANCSPLAHDTNFSLSSIGGTGTTSTLFDDSTSTSLADFKSGVLGAYQVNWIFLLVEYFPSGNTSYPAEHVEVAIINTLTGQKRSRIRFDMGAITPVLAKNLPASVTVY